jgi:SUMO ligase MMS21 Smc5/6 complex component
LIKKAEIENKKDCRITIAVDTLPDVCSICLEEMNENSGELIELSCNHIYHKDCILSWFSKSKTCPCCRKNIEK